MNLPKLSPKLILIIILIILTLALIIFTLITKKPQPPSPKPQDLPHVSPPTSQTGAGNPNVQQEIMQPIQNQYPLLSSLPYENQQFRINYQAPLKLIVKIKQGTQAKIQPLVNQWIQSQKVDPSTHQFIFIKQ